MKLTGFEDRQAAWIVWFRGGQKYIVRLDRFTYNSPMATLTEVESLAFKLSEQQRAMLAARILDTLPPALVDLDDGIAEALRRDTEMDSDPSIGINLEQFDRQFAQRR